MTKSKEICKPNTFLISFLLFLCTALAGSIIPAIATTNAIVAGMIVQEAFKILQGKIDRARMVPISSSKFC
jgi:hypothetical protein